MNLQIYRIYSLLSIPKPLVVISRRSFDSETPKERKTKRVQVLGILPVLTTVPFGHDLPKS